MVTDRQKRSEQLSRQTWLRAKERLATARTSAEKLAAEFDLFRLAASHLTPSPGWRGPSRTPGERDQILDEVAEVIRRRRVTLGDFTSSTSHQAIRGGGRIPVPQHADTRVGSVTTSTGSKQ